MEKETDEIKKEKQIELEKKETTEQILEKNEETIEEKNNEEEKEKSSTEDNEENSTQDRYFNLKDLAKYIKIFFIFNVIGGILGLLSSILNPFVIPLALVNFIPIYYLYKMNKNLGQNLEKLTPYNEIPESLYDTLSLDFKTYLKTYIIVALASIVIVLISAFIIGATFMALL